MAASTSESGALVTSSRSTVGALLSITRAIAKRWRWPPGGDAFDARQEPLKYHTQSAVCVFGLYDLQAIPSPTKLLQFGGNNWLASCV